MWVIHDNFGCLPANSRELALVAPNDEEFNNLFSFETIDRGAMLSDIH